MIEVIEPRVSPDGRSIAFVVVTPSLIENEYGLRVWMANAGGSSPPEPVTDERGRCSHPRWSPHGARLAFVRSREPDGGLAGAGVSTVAIVPAGAEPGL